MSDKRMTMGVIVGSRGFFPHHLAKSGREEMLQALALAVQFVLFASGFFDNWYALRPRIWASRAPKAP